jgi:hypothetical protein
MARLYGLLVSVAVGALLLAYFLHSEEEKDAEGSGPSTNQEPGRQEAMQDDAPAFPEPVDRGEPTRVLIPRRSPSEGGSSSSTRESLPSNGLVIAGRVVDDVGAPVPEFTIEMARPGAEDVDRSAKEHSRAFSDRDGQFRIEGLSSGQWQLTAHLGVDRRSAPVVVDTAGTAVPGASVFLLLAAEDEPRFYYGRDPEPRVRADDAGRFRIEDVLPGVVKLMARQADFADSEWMDVTALPGEQRDDVRIVLNQGGRVEGTVDSSLSPVANRKLGLFSFRGSIGWRNAETDAGGRFVIEHVIPQDYVIELRPEGYGERGSPSQPGIRRVITVEEGKTTEVPFSAATRRILVRGTIRSQGTPAPGLTVKALVQEGGDDRGEEFTTGFDGNYELTVDRPGPCRFRVSSDRHSIWFERTIPDAETVVQDFEIPSGRIAGRVLSDDGEPLPGVRVSLVREPDPAEDDSNFWTRYSDSYTRADGSFEFRLLVQGTYALRAPDGFWRESPPSHVPHGRVLRDRLMLEDDRTLDGLDLRLAPEGRIAGQVVDLRGTPVGEAAIMIEDLEGRSLSAYWETQSDATGHFEVPSIGPGTYRAFARTREAEGRSEPVLVEAGRTATTGVVVQ